MFAIVRDKSRSGRNSSVSSVSGVKVDKARRKWRSQREPLFLGTPFATYGEVKVTTEAPVPLQFSSNFQSTGVHGGTPKQRGALI